MSAESSSGRAVAVGGDRLLVLVGLGRSSDHDHLAAGTASRAPSDVLRQVGVRDEHSSPRVAQDVGELVGLEVPVHEHHRSAQLVRGRPRLEELDRVRDHDGDAVVGADPATRERVGEPSRPVVEVGVA